MKKNIFLFIVVLMLVPALAAGQPAKTDPGESKSQAPAQEEKGEEKNTLEMLHSIVRLKDSLKQRIAKKKQLVRKAESDTEKGMLTQEIEELDRKLVEAAFDFKRIATGVEVELFSGKKEAPFNWKDELLSLAEPGIREIKRMTQKARHKTGLRDELSAYEALKPVAIEARTNLEALMAEVKDPELKKNLMALVPEFRGIETQVTNKLSLIQLQLDEIDREEESLLETTQDSVKNFFRTRGLFLFIAVIACVGVVFLIRFGFRNAIRLVPGYRNKYRPFHIRVLELAYRIMTLALALLTVIMVFYLFEDWVLLSLAIIFLMGVGWAAKNTLPGFVHQSRMMLNIGSVREGERLIYHGVPWLVKRINVFCILENPTLDVQLRVPIEDLMDKISREFHPSEPWFPCRKNDWVILADGTRGGVVQLSHENVELVLRGGARKTYQTADFLSLSPLNLSVNFRLKVPFGIAYAHQEEATTAVPEQLAAHIQARIEAEGYGDDLLNLRVEFAEAGASSLDLVVIADFKGKMAPVYNRLNRAIQRWCVDAATRNGWDIPFPQLMVHKG